MFKICFYLFPRFKECEAKICHFLVNFAILCIFVTGLFPRNNNYGTWKKSKNKDNQNASLACIFENLSKNLILL